MLHLNTLLREKHGVFSKEFTRSRLADPEFYLAQEIASINESLLTVTQMKVFSPGKKLVGQSVIFIPACSFQSTVSEKEETILQTKFKEEFEKKNFWQNKSQNIQTRAKNSATRNVNENHISVQKSDSFHFSCISPPLEKFTHQMFDLVNFSKAATTNGQLQDQTGTLPIVCPFSIPEGTALTNVLLFYYHQLGIYRLENSDQTPAKNTITIEVLGRLNKILRIKESV